MIAPVPHLFGGMLRRSVLVEDDFVGLWEIADTKPQEILQAKVRIFGHVSFEDDRTNQNLTPHAAPDSESVGV